jgi:tetratricopeptide (TPR) repeat protein
MTLSLSLPDQFAAPFDVQPVDPSAWSRANAEPAPGEPSGELPGFLIRARDATEKNPGSALAWARLAQAAQGAHQREEAVTAAARALEFGVAQRSEPAIHAAMIVLAAYGCTDPLRILLDDPRGGALTPEARIRAAIELRDLDAAMLLLEEQTSAEMLVVRAWVQLERGNYQGAIVASREARRAGAAGPALLINLGFAHATLGNLTKAINVTREAAALSPLDRVAGFNLAGFHRALGDFDRALAALERLQTGPYPDFELALALAEVVTAAEDKERAHRILQRVRTSERWAQADNVRRCELDANLALLRCTTQRTDTGSATKAVLRALQTCDYQSVSIAYLLLNLFRSPGDAGQLDAVVGALESKHPREALLPLRMHLAVLRRESDSAVAYAVAWSETDVLNATAAAVAIQLLSDLQGRVDEAADRGLAALRRNPANALLINNTAYALARANRPREALRLLDRPHASPARMAVALHATRALAQMMGGNISGGLAGYREARARAEETDDLPLARLVDINLMLALTGIPDGAGRQHVVTLSPTRVLEGWARRIEFWIVAERARRELGSDAQYWFPGLLRAEDGAQA